jgi:hypothetical protein
MRAYFSNVLVALDQFVNTIFGGHPDETISSRWGRGALKGDKLDTIGADALNTIQPGHTTGAIEHDKERAELVEGIEQRAQK